MRIPYRAREGTVIMMLARYSTVSASLSLPFPDMKMPTSTPITTAQALATRMIYRCWRVHSRILSECLAT